MAAAALLLAVPAAARSEGSGRIDVVPAPAIVPPSSAVTYRVAVEAGLPVDPGEFASQVGSILADPSGWVAAGAGGFARVSTGGRFTIYLVAPSTADAMCRPLRTGGYLSCHNRGRVVINADRWTHGAAGWWGPLDEYRRYVVNHEVGHFLGHRHVPCPEPGAPAPIMMQQTKGLGPCLPNGRVVPEIVLKGPDRLPVR